MSTGGAYGASRAQDTDFRKKWDKEEYAEKAKKKDEEERDRMKENEERMKQGKYYVPGRVDVLMSPSLRKETKEVEEG